MRIQRVGANEYINLDILTFKHGYNIQFDIQQRNLMPTSAKTRLSRSYTPIRKDNFCQAFLWNWPSFKTNQLIGVSFPFNNGLLFSNSFCLGGNPRERETDLFLQIATPIKYSSIEELGFSSQKSPCVSRCNMQCRPGPQGTAWNLERVSDDKWALHAAYESCACHICHTAKCSGNALTCSLTTGKNWGEGNREQR